MDHVQRRSRDQSDAPVQLKADPGKGPAADAGTAGNAAGAQDAVAEHGAAASADATGKKPGEKGPPPPGSEAAAAAGGAAEGGAAAGGAAGGAAGAWEADAGLMDAMGLGGEAAAENAAAGAQGGAAAGGAAAAPKTNVDAAGAAAGGAPAGSAADTHGPTAAGEANDAAAHREDANATAAAGGGGGAAGGAHADAGGGGGAAAGATHGDAAGGAAGATHGDAAAGGAAAGTGGAANADAGGGAAAGGAGAEKTEKPDSGGSAGAAAGAAGGGGGGGAAGGGGGEAPGDIGDGAPDAGDGGGGGGDAGGGDVQARAAGGMQGGDSFVHEQAEAGVAGGGGQLPHLDAIQSSFGHHDVGGVQAHTGPEAAAATQAIGAEAYATGDQVAFGGGGADLHTAAHEAAHVVQQRAGVNLKGGVGEAGDRYEQHADAVADRVVAGESAQGLLDEVAPGGGAAGSGGGVQLRGESTAISLDELRHAIDDSNAANCMVGFRGLTAADKRRLAADPDLTARLVRVVGATDGLTIISGLALPRRRALTVGSQALPSDTGFLTSLLRQLRLNTLPALGGAAADLGACPAFLVVPVLDPIINGAGVTAQQQATFAATTAGETIVRATWGGQNVLMILRALGNDLAVIRSTFSRNQHFATWVTEDEALLLSKITATPDGILWARVMWGTPREAWLIRWVTTNPAYWGQTLGEALLHPAGGDGTKLKNSAALAQAVFTAIGGVQGAPGLALVLAALRYTLAERVKFMSAGGMLSAEGVRAILDAPGVTAAQQSTLSQDADAVNLIKAAVAGRLPNEVFAVLAGDPSAFCTAVARKNAFTDWVIADEATLVRIVAAVVNYNKWVDALKTIDNAVLFINICADTGIQAQMRAATVARHAYHWLITKLPHPVAENTQASTLLALFGDGAGISLGDKLITWQCVFRTPLKKSGEDLVMNRTLSGGEAVEDKYFAVDPNNDAMNLFFHQFRQLPRTHVDTAAAIMMCQKFHVKVTDTAGVVKYYNTNNSPPNVVAAPGKVSIDTSYYMNNNWIVMRATTGGGAPDAARIGSQFGAPEAVNTPGVDPLSGGASKEMTMFANHATHEVGHAVGNRTLTHGGFNMTGDNWALAYGNWAQAGNAEGYARTCGFPASMDGTNYPLTDPTDPTITSNPTGAQIRGFLCGIAQNGPGGSASHSLTTTFGNQNAVMNALIANATIGATGLFKTVNRLWGSFPGEGYHFPEGVDAGAASVHFFCTRWGNRWVTYDKAAFDARVSNYAVSSYKEMFAEMYTKKFTGGALPAANNSQTPATFFTALEQASPTELGLPAAPPAAATPGAAGAGPERGPGGAAGAGPAAAPRPRSDAEIAGDLGSGQPGRPWSIGG